MTGFAALLLLPLVSVLGYRRSGAGWGRASAVALVAVLASAIGIAIAVAYSFFLTTDAALCGDQPTVAGVVAIVPYVVVGSWAALRPRRVWAWAAAPVAAVAVLLLVSYFFAGAHDYCET
jgi:hypothetical protein